MFLIFPETHRIVAKELHKNLKKEHKISLNEVRMIWGAISPDFLPRYRLMSHYYENSIQFITNEIVSLIYLCQYVDLYNLSRFQKKIISTKIGVISHYLCDYTCLPHAEYWTFHDSFKKHYIYEKKLASIATNHVFDAGVIQTKDMSVESIDRVLLKKLVKEYISDVINEYQEDKALERDLDYAISLNTSIFSFVFETAMELNLEKNLDKSIVF